MSLIINYLQQDSGITIAETGAITNHVAAKCGNGRLSVQSNMFNFAHLIFWYQRTIGSLQLVTKALERKENPC